MINVSEMIVRSAEALLSAQRIDGSFIEGHNGPYYDEELPIRNTAHTLILMLKAHELTGEVKYRNAAISALGYITEDERRPMGATFWMRKKPEKDFSNGLIGQAWVMESLLHASQALFDDAIHRIAEQVFLLHPFDQKLARWRVVNVDGSYAHVDMTFNHQLWFAAVGSFIQGSQDIDDQINQFLDKLDLNLKLYTSGLIVHELGGLQVGNQPLKRRIKQSIKSLVFKRRKPDYENARINKAIGYHAFNTYAFCLLFHNRPNHQFWDSEVFSRILLFLQTDLYRDGLEYFAHDNVHNGAELQFNRFGYPYNPPGIEVAYTLQTFSKYFKGRHKKLIPMWLGLQLEKTYDPITMTMRKHTDDEATLAARMYEATRLNNWRIQQFSLSS